MVSEFAIFKLKNLIVREEKDGNMNRLILFLFLYAQKTNSQEIVQIRELFESLDEDVCDPNSNLTYSQNTDEDTECPSS